MNGATLHTIAFTALVKKVFDELEPKTIADLAAIWPPRDLDVEHCVELGLDVGVDDYEEAGLGPTARKLVLALHAVLPRNDPDDRWASPAEARETLAGIFGDRLRSHVAWKDPLSDDALIRLCTHGLAAHMLDRGDEPGTWKVDLGFLASMPVRRGFVRLGAVLTLMGRDAASLAARSITWARGTSTPDDADWELAKLAFRVSVGTAATVRDHAVKNHFLSANAAVIATRKKLPGTHPVRAFLRPFQFRTPAINSGAIATLIPERAIFHRLFALEWDGLRALYAHAKADYRFRTLPDELAARGVEPASLPGVPYVEDALDLWTLEHTLVTEYLDAIGMRPDPEGDPALRAWHAELVRVLPPTAGVPPIATREQLASVLTRLIFDATAFHEQVGGAIGDYLGHVGFVVPTMLDGRTLEQCWPSRNTMIQGTMLGVLTNFAMPGIRSDFSSIVPRQAAPVVRRWINGLGALARRIEARNATRAQPLVGFHPDWLEISVSI